MFIDARQVAEGSRLEADLCIIGGGAAGITIARELRGRGTRVALLESGDRQPDAATQALYAGTVTGLPYFPLDTCRLRQFGGTTNHWGGLCRPFDAVDFQSRDWIPGSGWPIDRAAMEPYYARAAPLMRVPFPQDWTVERWTGRDHRPRLPFDPARVESQLVQILPQRVRDFGKDFETDLGQADDVMVYLWANVTEIETDENGTSVTGLRVATLSGRTFRLVAHRFVLATGGLENPRLLLASRARRSAGIGNEHGHVGRHFLEHPRFVAGLLAPADQELRADFYAPHHVGGAEIEGYLELSRALQRSERLAEVEVRLGLDYDPGFDAALESGDVQAFRDLARDSRSLGTLGPDVLEVMGDLMTWRRSVLFGPPIPLPFPELIGQLIRSTPAEVHASIPDLLGDIVATGYLRLGGPLPISAITLTTRIDPQPNPDSRVSLTDELDPLGVPRIALDWRLSELDRHSARRTLELLAAEVGRVSIGRVRLTFDEAGSAWPPDLAGGWHHMGTTRMATRPEDGVVDADCKVHGMANLWVAGSSVFATAGSGTPTFLLVALALRLADHLRAVST